MQTNQKGLTLVEVLAVVIIFGLVMALTFQTLFSLTKQTDKLSSRFSAYADANISAQVILNSVYDMKLEKTASCGSNCFELINRPKKYIDASGDEQTSSEVKYLIRITNGNFELINDNNRVVITKRVASNSTITSTCQQNSCLEAVITLNIYFDLDDGSQYQSITTIAH